MMRAYRWIFLLGLAVGVAALFILFSSDTPEDPRAPRESDQAARENGQAASGGPDGLSETLRRPELDLDGDSGPMIIVDSFAPDDQMPLDAWRRTNDASGHFDRLAVIGEAGALEDRQIVRAGDVLVAQGWAGERQVGIRYADVLLVMCDRVVARAPIALDRPDVAENVHPNLDRSGWEAQIIPSDLPVCADNRLTAWAVVRANPPFLSPLIGGHPVVIGGEGGGVAAHTSAQAPVSPDSYGGLDVVRIEIAASRANLRACAGTGCARVAQVDQGIYPTAVLDHVDGWSLVAFADKIGWLFDDLYRVVE